MALKIVKESGPVQRQAVRFEIGQRKGKAVIDADQRWRVLSEPLDQPFGDAAPRSIFARRRRWRDLDGRRITFGNIDA